MDTGEKVTVLVSHIRNLKGFELLPPSYPYNHMGATITDSMLQAGLNWKNVVKPRIEKVRKYQQARQTSGVLVLLEEEGACKLLDWLDDEKPNRVLGIARFLKSEAVETEEDLKSWLAREVNIGKLMKQRGIGNKTLDYIKMLAGIPSIAIDRHMNSILKEANVHSDGYIEARSIIGKAAELMCVDKHVLDHSIWKYMSSRQARFSSNERPCTEV